MTRDFILEFAERQAALLVDGETATVAANMTFPLPVYLPHCVTVFSSPKKLIAQLNRFRFAMIQTGIVRLLPWDLRISDATSHRAFIGINWEHLDGMGKVRFKACVSYVIRLDPETENLQVELVEFSEPGFGALAAAVGRSMTVVSNS